MVERRSQCHILRAFVDIERKLCYGNFDLAGGTNGTQVVEPAVRLSFPFCGAFDKGIQPQPGEPTEAISTAAPLENE